MPADSSSPYFRGSNISEFGESRPFAWFQPLILVIVVLATSAVITMGSLYKTWELRGGGEHVAVMLGGRQICPSTDEHAERRLLNVVEEMALASGVAVPPVYLLPGEYGINAFAAGFTPDDAVIGVSQGALDHLSRDELQGVIAHEFSHILNGDMRFNLRLIGLLHGILVVGLIGYYMLRTGGGSGRSSGRGGKGGVQIIALGLVILVVGYVGLFFGRLIKAAVSRQREYLADASAVQFTRNPLGIGGALKKIGGLFGSSFIGVPSAETASHMFFGSAFRHWAHSPFATHPPLADRVRAIDPQFDGSFPKIQRTARPEPSAVKSRPPAAPAGEVLAGLGKPLRGLGFGERFPLDPAGVIAAVGAPSMDHVDYSSQLLSSLPASVTAAIREPFSARCVVFALLLDSDHEIRQLQIRLLIDEEGEPASRESARLAEQLAQIDKSVRLPLVEFVQGTLRQLSPEQYSRFRRTVYQLIKADEKINLFEFVLQCVLLNHLDRTFSKRKPPQVLYYSVRGVVEEVVVLMSALAHVGHRDAQVAEATFQQAVAPLQLDASRVAFLDSGQCSLSRIKSALQKLATCSMPVKKRVLGTATLCVAVDGTITVGEAELLRAVADSLDCPIPPIIPGKVKQLN